MINAKDEFIEHINGARHNMPEVLCAQLCYWYGYGEKLTIYLKKEYTEDDFNEFVSSIDFEYDNGYGSQLLDGTIWYKDGTYSGRGEYDGSEWWDYFKAPAIPKDLMRK